MPVHTHSLVLDDPRRRDRDLRLRTARLGAERLDCLHDVQALGNLAEYDVLAVKPRRDHGSDEELQTDEIRGQHFLRV